MSIQLISSSNNSQVRMIPKQPVNERPNGSALRVYDAQEKAPAKVKIGAFLGTLTGVAIAMFATFKAKKMPVNSIKDFCHNLTHVDYKEEKWGIEKLITRLTVGSVGGGLIGGVITDKKENRKAKYREAIIQVIGNIYTPLICVDGGIKAFEKFAEPSVIKALKLGEKTKGIPKAIVSIGCLVGGLFLGNKVGNTINEKAFGVKDNRKIKLADLSPQIDDACVAISLVASTSKIGDKVSRIIPAALMIAGYSTGVIQERPERLNKSGQ